jgi:dolichyl-phosphate beta-glucosyltransferase
VGEGGFVTEPRWSVVIPAFNEASRLPRYLEEVVVYLGARGEPWEVVVVDDGSTDDTPNVVRAMHLRHREVSLLRQESNAGKGAAVRAGMVAARGAWRLFADADGATPIAELKRLEAALAAGADVAIGSRAMPAAGIVVRAQRHRIVAGRVFNRVVEALGLPGIEDSQCGFKAFTAAAAADLFPRLVTTGFGFDVELLLRAHARGWRVVEVAVNWEDQPASKVGVLKDGPRMLWQILAARRRVAREERRES